ncbi:hypothetical protein NFI96_005120 [Prochilodus magdalenae]|nr:hypothetical protein NFI96_005120 [Prochilodus magdalenae]
MFKLHGMDYHRTPLGTSTAPYRDVWRVGLANTTARHRHTERQTSWGCGCAAMWGCVYISPVETVLDRSLNILTQDGAVGVEGHQVFWTCDNQPFILVLTTVPPHTDSLGVSTKTKAGLVTEDDPPPFWSLHDSLCAEFVRRVRSCEDCCEMCVCVDVRTAEQFVCTASAVADIVILVDGSWSIGRLNFRLVRMFLENLVNAFDVGITKVRIGLAQYSGDPRIEWHLNAFTTKDSVIDAVKNLPYKGGNTLTGLALTYILKNSFKPESGARSNVPKIGILITDGKSQDAVDVPAQSLRDAGVELFAVGSCESRRAFCWSPDTSVNSSNQREAPILFG